MLDITPIRLIAGSHSDTGKTGSGCFMNVIAYLNGEPQITDASPCVCAVVRPLAIWLNDFGLGPRFTPTQRAANSDRLLPFVLRAQGSATDDAAERSRRAYLALDFAREMKDIAADAAADAADAAADARWSAAASRSAAEAADAAAADAAAADAADAARWSAAASRSAAEAADAADAAAADARHQRIFDAGIRFLGAALPPADAPTQETIERSQRLVEMCRKTGACV